jgi:actin-related protein 8
MRALKLRGTTNGTGLAAAYNEQVTPETMGELNDPFAVEWTDPSENVPAFVGDSALRLVEPERAGYAVRWPIKRGRLNKEGYRSMQELAGDIQELWTIVLRDELGIQLEELKVCVFPSFRSLLPLSQKQPLMGFHQTYSAILIVPDLYDHEYIRELADVMLRGIGFKQISMQQVRGSHSVKHRVPVISTV